MAVDKLVDSTQLDADLTAVANAIRTKGGTSGQLAFPSGFVSAVQAIPTGITPTGTKQINIIENGTTTEDVAAFANAEITVNVQGGGGEWTTNGLADRSEPRGALLINNVAIAQSAFYGAKNITSVHIVNVDPKNINGTAFAYCTGLTTFVAQKIYDWAASAVQGCSSLTTIDAEIFRLLINYGFQLCANLSTIILRRSDAVTTLQGIQCFNGTPFASGGTGGTIYIPKALYDHLGDGSALDYKAATNWSTIDGYGTITWAQIEGSQYENYYADGTPIT